MGGRGASFSTKSNIGGAKITFNDKTTEYYFYKGSKGENLYGVGLGDTPRPTPQNMTAKEFIERAKKNGAEVETITEQERINREKKLAEEHRNKPDYELGYGVPWDNREYRKTARNNKKMTRGQKRRR